MTDANLSPREAEVVELVGSGKTYREAAEAMDCSISTLSVLAYRIRDKAGLGTMKPRDAMVHVYIARRHT